MSTTPLTDAINALTQYANETTGASDTTLSDAVGTLVAGYGGGGVSLDDFVDGSEPTGAVTLSTATAIRKHIFRDDTAITSVTGNSVLTIGDAAFQGCSNLTAVSFPNATTLGVECFRQCKLASVSFPEVTTAANGGNLRENISTLISASLPKLTAIQPYMFYNDQKLTTLDLSEATSVGNNAFQQCYELATLDLPKVTSIAATGFYNARKLTTLILRHTSVVTVANANAFTNTPLAGYNSQSATVYVPQSLISSYQTASVWSTLYSGGHCTFAAIEGSQYE